MSNFQTKILGLTQEQAVLLVEDYIKDISHPTITPREKLFFELEPFLREFNEYSVRDPKDGRSEFGYTANYILTTAKGAGKKYRSSLFAWLSYYHRKRAIQFANLVKSQTGVLLVHYNNHPSVSSPCSDNAKRVFVKQEEHTSINNQENLVEGSPKPTAKENDSLVNVIHHGKISNLRIIFIGKFNDSIPIPDIESQFNFPSYRKNVWNSHAYYNEERADYPEYHSKENPLKLESCYNDIFALVQRPTLNPIESSFSEENSIIDQNGIVIGKIEALKNDIKSECFFLNNESVMATAFYNRHNHDWDNGRISGYILLHKREISKKGGMSNKVASWRPFSFIEVRDDLNEKIVFCPCNEDKAVLAVTTREILIMDATQKAILWKKSFGQNSIYKACLSSDNSLLAVTYSNIVKKHELDLETSNSILIFDLKNGKCISNLTTSEDVAKQHFEFSALSESQKILIYSSGNGLIFYNYIENKFLFPFVVGDFPAFERMEANNSYLQFSSDGRHFRVGGPEHQWVYEINNC